VLRFTPLSVIAVDCVLCESIRVSSGNMPRRLAVVRPGSARCRPRALRGRGRRCGGVLLQGHSVAGHIGWWSASRRARRLPLVRAAALSGRCSTLGVELAPTFLVAAEHCRAAALFGQLGRPQQPAISSWAAGVTTRPPSVLSRDPASAELARPGPINGRDVVPIVIRVAECPVAVGAGILASIRHCGDERAV
jgi:hypothetical protein